MLDFPEKSCYFPEQSWGVSAKVVSLFLKGRRGFPEKSCLFPEKSCLSSLKGRARFF